MIRLRNTMARRVALAMAGASLAIFSLAGNAQTPTVYTEASKLIHAPNAVTSLGPNLFGDSVNLYSGVLEFTQTDVSLPGNNALPVAIGRRLSSTLSIYPA